MNQIPDLNTADFLSTHSEHFIAMALSHNRRPRIRKPDGYTKHIADCGDTIELFLIIAQDKIQSFYFETDACIHTYVCLNTLGHLVQGLDLQKAWQITPESIVEYVETLPTEKHHCADLAVNVFHSALNNAVQLQRSPWKKAYTRE
jgi:nitrogen fixation NifU-like protein